jgi:hypothetical protein
MNTVLKIILPLFLLVAGCQDVKRPEPPENLLPKEKMVQILADAYISNASRSKSVNNRILRAKGVQLDSILYTKHGVDSLNFAESNAYYASNLDLYTGIIIEVEKVLLLKKARIDSLMGPDKAKKKQTENQPPTSLEKPKTGQLSEPVEDEGE